MNALLHSPKNVALASAQERGFVADETDRGRVISFNGWQF
jgi:hypothetical protein